MADNKQQVDAAVGRHIGQLNTGTIAQMRSKAMDFLYHDAALAAHLSNYLDEVLVSGRQVSPVMQVIMPPKDATLAKLLAHSDTPRDGYAFWNMQLIHGLATRMGNHLAAAPEGTSVHDYHETRGKLKDILRALDGDEAEVEAVVKRYEDALAVDMGVTVPPLASANRWTTRIEHAAANENEPDLWGAIKTHLLKGPLQESYKRVCRQLQQEHIPETQWDMLIGLEPIDSTSSVTDQDKKELYARWGQTCPDVSLDLLRMRDLAGQSSVYLDLLALAHLMSANPKMPEMVNLGRNELVALLEEELNDPAGAKLAVKAFERAISPPERSI